MDNNADTLLLAFSQGGKAGAVQKCVACRGRGMRIMIRQLAPGMVQQMQSVCTDCNGEGNVSPHACKLTLKTKLMYKPQQNSSLRSSILCVWLLSR